MSALSAAAQTLRPVGELVGLLRPEGVQPAPIEVESASSSPARNRVVGPLSIRDGTLKAVNLGATELLIVLLVVLVLFGGAKLPKLARSMGQAQSEFKRGLSQEGGKSQGGKGDDQDEADTESS